MIYPGMIRSWMCNRYIDAAINGGPSVQRVLHSRLPTLEATSMHFLSQAHPEENLQCNRYIDAAINGAPSVQRVLRSQLPAFKATLMHFLSH